MFDLIPKNEATLMSSREIAELTGKQHAHVMRDIRAMMEQLSMNPDLDSCAKSSTYIGKDGRQYEQYELDKDTCMTLLLGYDPVARMKVVKRWQFLENNPQLPDFTDPAEAARAWAVQFEEKRKLAHVVQELAPRAEALDLISASDGSLTYTEAAKVLGLKRKDMTARMHAEGWHYRLNGSWVAYDKHIKNGNLQYKEAKYTDENTGQECLKPYSHVTPRGLSRLALLFGKPLPPEVAQPADQNIRLAFFA